MGIVRRMSERKAFKDYFDRAAAKALAAQVAAVHPSFDEAAFVRQACKGLKNLEFNGRVGQFGDALRVTLPEPIPEALAILERSLPPPLPDCESVTDGWLQWPLGQFVADHAVDHLEAAFPFMVELTQRFSSEFAVRPFIEHQQAEVIQRMEALTGHPSPHVRRWCSEGLRPRLPWGKKLTALAADPSPVWPILEALKDDPEQYVRRSVANHVNDIAKAHPELVIKRAKAWMKGASPEREWVVKHALRGLFKNGHPGALAVFGFHEPKHISVNFDLTPKRCKIGGQVTLHAELKSSHTKAQNLMIDYVIRYVSKTGGTSTKVFKWKELKFPAGDSITLEKRQAMKNVSIRTLYPGTHHVELQINGQRVAEASFEIV